MDGNALENIIRWLLDAKSARTIRQAEVMEAEV